MSSKINIIMIHKVDGCLEHDHISSKKMVLPCQNVHTSMCTYVIKRSQVVNIFKKINIEKMEFVFGVSLTQRRVNFLFNFINC